MRKRKEFMGASTTVLILGVLSRQPSYGYEIVKSVNDQAKGLFTWREGTIYPVLHKLEKDGLIRGKWQDSQSGPQRKYYYITAKGRAALSEDAQHWHGFYELISAIVGTRPTKRLAEQ